MAGWHTRAIIYQIDTALFYDLNGDSCGDIAGIAAKLRYIRRMGATVIWITPFYLTPFLDEGYDVSDHLQVDPRFGKLNDIIAFIEQARELGMQVIIELLIQHTSDAHPWFQQARRNPQSPYRDYYLWSDTDDDDTPPMFPGVEKSIWTWDDEAGQYYRHMFYHHEPDLNLASPAVLKEVENIIIFWLKLGVSGFRLDAASHLTKQAGRGDEKRGLWILEHLRRLIEQRNPDAILLGEVDVEVEAYKDYFGQNDRLNLVLNFWLNKYFYVSLAEKSARPLRNAVKKMIVPPDSCCFANWLRNHDELDLEGIGKKAKQTVIDAFAPDKEMSVYQRGIRRRLAPMLNGDRKRLAFCHAVLFSLPGVPVMRYGDEIGMGDDLELEERYAVRTPMQWAGSQGGGFSDADPETFIAPMIDRGPYRYQKINVADSLLHRNSLLHCIIDIANTRSEFPEIGVAPFRLINIDSDAVLGIYYETDTRSILTFVNFSDKPVNFTARGIRHATWTACLADKRYNDALVCGKTVALNLSGYGYRWFWTDRTALR
ncbi:alpha-amylase family protein [Enterobacter hormaechei]|uniref:alpha-amylase family protein n=1 Tax=Enterobacter hormaechei TaxID=158836 RepID=UPI002826A0FA|nr:alpha-amylase family protein [Enterobacter hormaechei]ELB7312955.1 alpha-amylase family protein [Enterobacter hormaechei]ELQ3561511.1 alpha-amylase family protein [Enterobacter hormaechei]MCM8085571.1 alpha-amylase family protein [Enterobacter hormaechei]MDR9961682.1 alpha-amylase family protein [Enterobacter hormaechei subsp. xiangfangensis]HBM2734110.1 alpha-amylase family protein [Enterobacter hormaechei subsp. xiangfangensis]